MKLALVSKNPQLVEDFAENLADIEFAHFRSIDNIIKEDFALFCVDYEDMGDPDATQFYLSRLRKKIQNTPVMILLRVNSIPELEFTWFFDDFLIYPFRKGELRARLERLTAGRGEDDNEIVLGNLRVNVKDYTVYSGNKKIDLTYKEFELLRLFFQNRGTVFSRKEVLSRIWGLEYIGGTRTVDVHVRRLRSKLGDDFNSIIETVRNVGYKCIE